MLKRKWKNVKLEKFQLVKKFKKIKENQEFIKKKLQEEYEEKVKTVLFPINVEFNSCIEEISRCNKYKKQIKSSLNNKLESTLFEYLPSSVVRIIEDYTPWESCKSCGSLFPREFFYCLPCHKKSLFNDFYNGHLLSEELGWKTKGLVTNDMKFFCKEDELIAHYFNLFVLKPNLSIRTSKRIFFIKIEYDDSSNEVIHTIERSKNCK